MNSDLVVITSHWKVFVFIVVLALSVENLC